jgi:hypothetical protein
MRKMIALAAAALSVLAFTVPGQAATRHAPRILTGAPFYLQINTNNCLNSNGVNNQLTSDNQAGGCTNWHAVALGGIEYNVANGANNCMRENSANQITVVSNCSQNATAFIYDTCGTNCYKLNNVAYGNFVSVSGPDSGNNVWGGNGHIDWMQF